MDIKENIGFKMAESLFKNVCTPTCNSSKFFHSFFLVSFALDERLIISALLEDIELICQIQRDLELGFTPWIN